MKATIPNSPIDSIFASNLLTLIGNEHTITSLSRDLQIHRNQLQRFVDGLSFPKPDMLFSICAFFDVDARILTNPLDDLRHLSDGALPSFLMDGVEPAPPELLPDGFYEEWRPLIGSHERFVCHLLHVRTFDRVRRTKVVTRKTVASAEGEITELDSMQTIIGVALLQAGGLCILDRPAYGTGLTFTALRFDAYGEPDVFVGHKRSVRSVVGSGLTSGSATALRRLKGGFQEAMKLRRQPRFRSTDETPEMIQWLLKEQLVTQPYG
jgi:hypothetical protein